MMILRLNLIKNRQVVKKGEGDRQVIQVGLLFMVIILIHMMTKVARIVSDMSGTSYSIWRPVNISQLEWTYGLAN
jgi:hypothetical protein